MKKGKEKISFIKSIILIINIVFAILLLANYLCSLISPLEVKYLSLLSLIYPYLLIVNVIFVFYWLLNQKRFSLISLIVILIGFNSIGKWFQWSGEKLPEKVESFKLLSYNVHVMGIDNHSISTKDSIIQILSKENSDIVCLQEFYDRKDAILEQLRQELNLPYLQKFTSVVDGPHTYGMLTMSKYPIINQGEINFENSIGNNAIYADIVFNADTIRIYNVHLQSLHFANKDYVFANKIINKSSITTDELKEGSRQLVRKFINGAMKRTLQVQVLLNHIQQSPYKTIICGDFNDTPWSYCYAQLSKDKKDAFIESGKWFSKTMKINKILSFRIDYILYDKTLNSLNYRVSDNHLSDHEYIVTEITNQKVETTVNEDNIKNQ